MSCCCVEAVNGRTRHKALNRMKSDSKTGKSNYSDEDDRHNMTDEKASLS